MAKKSPSDVREMLTLLRECGVDAEQIKDAAINAAREFGISFGAPTVKHESVADFFEGWRASSIPLPLIPCMSSDLYQAYQIWCKSEDREASTHTGFVRDLKIIGVARVHIRSGNIIDPTSDFGRAFDGSVAAFAKALRKYQKTITRKTV